MPVNRSTRIVARLFYVAPVLLVLLTLQQLWSAYDIHRTLQTGIPAVAEVRGHFSSERVEVSFDYVNLHVRLPDGRVLVRERFTLPHSFAPLVENQKTVRVRVREGAHEPIVIESLGRAHWRLAGINALMSLIGAVITGAGAVAWNRYLSRRGDPALAPATS